MNRQETISLLSEFGIQPTRSLGQNFLTDDHVIEQICDLAELSRQDLVIEIGPGIGSLTRELAQRAGQVIGVEIDRHVLPALRQNVGEYPNCIIQQADALSISLSDFVTGWEGSVKVVANLPYYIMTPLMVKLLCELPQSQKLVLMIQKEAAGRVLALPGSKQYGPLAVLVACFGLAKQTITIPAVSFFPRPHVDSCVIRINATRQLQIKQWKQFHQFLESCFAQRRKTLVNSLKNAGMSSAQQIGAMEWLKDQQLSADLRAEKLAAAQFVALYQKICCDNA